jgi:hypothetical protein
MKRRWTAGLAMSLVGVAAAEDITDKDSFVCTGWDAVYCTTEGTCEHTEAWRLNLPDFLKVDLDAKEFTTLPGSEVTRFTPIDSIARESGRIFLNGSQARRGFSWVINESTGEGTVAILSDATAITLFIVCAAT